MNTLRPLHTKTVLKRQQRKPRGLDHRGSQSYLAEYHCTSIKFYRYTFKMIYSSSLQRQIEKISKRTSCHVNIQTGHPIYFRETRKIRKIFAKTLSHFPSMPISMVRQGNPPFDHRLSSQCPQPAAVTYCVSLDSPCS